MKKWIAPSEFMQELERVQHLREDGTAGWIFDEPKFSTWKSHQHELATKSAQGSVDDYIIWVYGTLFTFVYTFKSRLIVIRESRMWEDSPGGFCNRRAPNCGDCRCEFSTSRLLLLLQSEYS